MRAFRLRPGSWVWLTFLACLAAGEVRAAPHIPTDANEVLGSLPLGVSHSSLASRHVAVTRIDVAMPLAQFYITQARATGDLRFLGYAEAVLEPWRTHVPVSADVLVLHATILQSRHEFDAALKELDQALATQPDNAQAWLTRATVLRVLGRYDDALQSCSHLVERADPSITALCRDGVQARSGRLNAAYADARALPTFSLTNAARAWRDSEVGEMAEGLGDRPSAERWFTAALKESPDDQYTRAAYADLLLAEHRDREVTQLLGGFESMEPLLLRLVIAQKNLGESREKQSEALLSSAFDAETQRGDAVHRREQARFLLDVKNDPKGALVMAQKNWQMQREPDDALILLRAAAAAGQPTGAAEVLTFIREHNLQDSRVMPYVSVRA